MRKAIIIQLLKIEVGGSYSASFLLSNHRQVIPPNTPPMMGITRKNYNCVKAMPPSNNAGPELRAGFTEVLVTGMLIR